MTIFHENQYNELSVGGVRFNVLLVTL